MKNFNQILNTLYSKARGLFTKQTLVLAQFFLIIFVYHILKDLKDTLVITASDAGAEVIPFLKIWGMLPLAILASYLFSKIYQKFGREKTLYLFLGSLLVFYSLFAFFLYPHSQGLYPTNFETFLRSNLPGGCKGLIAMVCYWPHTLFYLTAELWSLIILSILFWGYVNDTSSLKEAKRFYPLCIFTGNCAGILSGQTSRTLCTALMGHVSWQETLQVMIAIVIFCGMGVMWINRLLSLQDSTTAIKFKDTPKVSFKESLQDIFKSPPLFYIAFMVVGFGLTSNLLEVIWKDSIKSVYSSPAEYNAYVNQLTSIIGILAVIMALVARWAFHRLSWSTIALATPIALFGTSLIFYLSLHMPSEHLSALSSYTSMSPGYLIMTLGSIYYVLGLTAKYTIFDMSKEMAFLSMAPETRMRSKSIIDSIGSRLGKSGSSCIYQILLIGFGSTAGNVSVIALLSLFVMGTSIMTTKKLGRHLC